MRAQDGHRRAEGGRGAGREEVGGGGGGGAGAEYRAGPGGSRTHRHGLRLLIHLLSTYCVLSPTSDTWGCCPFLSPTM